jgi:putative PIN family toxin of toxin-antitoxin system
MKVVLDTNVIIAAFAARGLCADIMEYCLYEDILVLSEDILHEVGTNMRRKIKMPEHKTDELVSFLRAHAKIVKPSHVAHDACRDKDDLMVLGTAAEAKADIIVTGDKDLLVLKSHDFIPIVTPRNFWEFIRKKRE